MSWQRNANEDIFRRRGLKVGPHLFTGVSTHDATAPRGRPAGRLLGAVLGSHGPGGGSGRQRRRHSCDDHQRPALRARARTRGTRGRRRLGLTSSAQTGRSPTGSHQYERGHRVPGQLRVRRKLQRHRRSTTSRTRPTRRPDRRLCPGGQSDVSVYGNLLFMSVEETRGRDRLHADAGGGRDHAVPRRPRVRHLEHRRPAAGRRRADLPRLAHAHAGEARTIRTTSTSTSRERPACAPATELAGCDGNNTNTPTGENPSKWRIDVIKVPVADPATAAIVGGPRLFANEAAGERPAERVPTPHAPVGEELGPTPITDACHDITVYEELDLAAGACEGNGILIDISDPANPMRLDAVADPLFSYWHGATFSNDGKTVVFTDEWGGGTGARCRATDQLNWGATRSTTSSTASWSSAATTSCRSPRRRPGELRQPQRHPSSRSPAATCWSRPGTRAACHSSTSPTRRTRWRSRYFDRGPIGRDRARPRRIWSPTGTTAASTARRSRAASTRTRLTPIAEPVGGRDRRGRACPHVGAHQRPEPGPALVWTSEPVPRVRRWQGARHAVAESRRR